MTYRLTTTITGQGQALSIPIGIVCGGDCLLYLKDTVIEVTHECDDAWRFVRWSESCTQVNSCEIVMGRDKALSAHFARKGDLNSDGQLSVADAIVGLQALSGEDVNLSIDVGTTGNGQIAQDDTLLQVRSLSQ